LTEEGGVGQKDRKNTPQGILKKRKGKKKKKSKHGIECEPKENPSWRNFKEKGSKGEQS